MGLGPSPQYLAKYNNYVLPGYVQSEEMESTLNIASHYGAYLDGSDSEDVGLANKNLSLSLKVWETDYLTCKQQIELAGTIIRSSRTFTSLYVQYTDRHYVALAKSIQMNKSVPSSVRTLDYSVEFECKPWLVGETLHQLSGTGTISTDQVGRSGTDALLYGAWTPTVITVTGTNVSITGQTINGEPTGTITVSGSVSGLVIDSEAFTAVQGSTNMNSVMNTDYRMYVGAGETVFNITGGSATIEYYDRWYI